MKTLKTKKAAEAPATPSFWRRKTLARLKSEQGINGPPDLDKLGQYGDALWESDKEFEKFLRFLRDGRRRG